MDRLGRDPKIVKIPNWHTNRQTPGLYNWILDLKEVQFRINTAWHRTIKATPLDALLKQNGSSWKKALDNIKEYAEKAYRGVKHDAHLVGHTPAEEETEGDYVRLRLFKAGDKNVKFTGKSTKSARDNFSEDIYRIMRVVTKENKARVFYIENIDPNGKQAPKAGLDRTQILKIHKDTKLSNGRTVQEEDAFLNKDDDDRVRCVACFMCATACPANCIHIVADESPWDDREKYPKQFDIDELRCIYCGMCEEACPCDAIELTPHYEITGLTRQELIFDKAKLLKVYDETIDEKPM